MDGGGPADAMGLFLLAMGEGFFDEEDEGLVDAAPFAVGQIACLVEQDGGDVDGFCDGNWFVGQSFTSHFLTIGINLLTRVSISYSDYFCQ